MRRVNTALAIICTVALSRAQGQNTCTEVQDMKLEQRTWPALSNGLVFVGGEFIPPPYVVSRVKNAIYINGKHVGTPGGWPNVQIQESVNSDAAKPIDPKIPSGITEKTTKYDDVYIRYIYEKRLYLFAVHGQQKGIDMMVDVYKSLPCIKDAKRAIDSNSIIVTWLSGELDRVTQVRPQRSQDNVTPEKAAKVFDDICEIYYGGLELNDYFLFGTVHRRGTQDGYGQFLVPIAEALKTAKDEEAFISVMTNKFPMVTGFSEKAFRSFYKHKDKLPQWEPLLQKRCRGRQ
jgi:hypothetical protein